MNHIANFLFEGRMLKEIPMSGYHFLGKGKESVAEHTFIVAFIAYVMSELIPNVNTERMISMCLLTETGMDLAQQILNGDPDEWWMKAVQNR